MVTRWSRQERKYVSLYIILKLWWKFLHMRQNELLAKVFWDVGRQYGNLVGGRENVSFKPEKKIWKKSSGMYVVK